VDVKGQRLVLISDIQANDLDTLTHVMVPFVGVVVPSFIAASRLRRFSKTADSRCGRCAALRKQAGTSSSAPSLRASDRSRRRTSPGDAPVISRKMRPKVP